MILPNIHLILILLGAFAPRLTALSADHSDIELVERGAAFSTLGNKNKAKITSHTVKLVVNSPGSKKAQSLRLMVDTGSTDLVLYTQNCQGCWSAPDHVKGYTPGAGAGRPYQTSYGDSANLAVVHGKRETAAVSLGEFTSQEDIAAVTSMTGGAHGNKLSEHQALLLVGVGFVKTKTPNGSKLQGTGTLVLGSYDKAFVKSSAAISWNRVVHNTAWTVHVDTTKPLKPHASGAGVALVDTGSNLITGPSHVVEEHYKQLKLLNFLPSYHYDKIRGTYTFPCGSTGRLDLEINGKTYQIRGEDLEIPTGNAGTCTGVLMAGGTPRGIDWVLGVPFLRTVYTIFDADEQRIGFYQK